MKNIKKTITIKSTSSFNIIKEYCVENGVKIGWFAEKILLDYIKHNNKNEK